MFFDGLTQRVIAHAMAIDIDPKAVADGRVAGRACTTCSTEADGT